MKIALWVGVFFSSHFWLYQLWAFVAPGLYRTERRAAAKLTAAAVSLMAGGAAFAYYVVIPAGFAFFLSFGQGEVTVLPAIQGYLSLVMTLLLAFGAAFQLPLLLLFLAAAGLVDSDKLSRFRRFAILAIVILAAFLTPPDVISQILMSIPLILLYELSLFMIRGRERATAGGGEGTRPAEGGGKPGKDGDGKGGAGKGGTGKDGGGKGKPGKGGDGKGRSGKEGGGEGLDGDGEGGGGKGCPGKGNFWTERSSGRGRRGSGFGGRAVRGGTGNQERAAAPRAGTTLPVKTGGLESLTSSELLPAAFTMV
jgi:Tat protein translocase TatC